MIALSTSWYKLRSSPIARSHSRWPGASSLFDKKQAFRSAARLHLVTYLTEVAKRLMDSETVFVCVASCCHWAGSLALMIRFFEQSTIRHAPSTTFRAELNTGSCSWRPYSKETNKEFASMYSRASQLHGYWSTQEHWRILLTWRSCEVHWSYAAVNDWFQSIVDDFLPCRNCPRPESLSIAISIPHESDRASDTDFDRSDQISRCIGHIFCRLNKVSSSNRICRVRRCFASCIT